MKKELKSLKRSELIEIIYQLKKSEQELQKENEALRKSLESKRISLANAGSIADAALALTDIFTTAQESADVYLAEIVQRKAELKRDYDLIIDEANSKADEIVRKANEQREKIISEARKAYTLLKQYEAAIEKKKAEYLTYKAQE